MATKDKNARTPVTATGLALLVMIAAAGGTMMLTQAEGQDIIAAGDATVDTTKTEGDTAAVSLTEAGQAKVDAENGKASASTTAAASSGSFDIDDGVAMPGASTRGRSGGYPFDKLEVGQSFHVAKTADNPNPADRLASSVSGARTKYAEDTGETETVKVKTYKKGENGKGFAKDADGKRIVESETDATRPKLKVTRDFTVKTVGADDPRGEGARVWRIA